MAVTNDGVLVECPDQEERVTPSILFLSHCSLMREPRVGSELLYSVCHLVFCLSGVLYG